MARLNALPYATMCISCQRDLERSGGGSGRPQESEEISGEMEIDIS
jgi:RNA polymerase-binding transcription factor DksA